MKAPIIFQVVQSLERDHLPSNIGFLVLQRYKNRHARNMFSRISRAAVGFHKAELESRLSIFTKHPNLFQPPPLPYSQSPNNNARMRGKELKSQENKLRRNFC